MANSFISRKYAKALLAAALEKQQLEPLLSEVLELEQSLSDSQSKSFLLSQIVPDEKKAALLNLLADKTSQLLGNYLKTLAKNRRYALLFDSLQTFKRLANTALGHDEVEVISALALTAAQTEKMVAVVKRQFALTNVQLVMRMDPSILGGFIIRNETKTLDLSIKSQLAKIATVL